MGGVGKMNDSKNTTIQPSLLRSLDIFYHTIYQQSIVSIQTKHQQTSIKSINTYRIGWLYVVILLCMVQVEHK